MSKTFIKASLRKSVLERANYRCEYCSLPEKIAFFSHEIDHIVPEKHGGVTHPNNLAYTCWRCNRHKGTDLGSFDPQTQEFSFLYHPRIHLWEDHFQRQQRAIIGLTPEGRTTAHLLKFNTEDRQTERALYLPFQDTE